MPRTTYRRALLVEEPSSEADTHVLFRIVKSPEPGDSLFDESFRSHYELRRQPRGVERRSAVLQMGLSMFNTGSQAARVAQTWPVIGEWVATVVILPGYGFNLARTGMPGHYTVWGRPEQLKIAVRGTVHMDAV